ncbi:hypothetical protein AVEN_145439-1 [Araneus ventricosus]|uniref:Uncharacterized protein n=1 Tax=Araneus ventricosus TaxID=182803 RepID=A0A4Y2B0X2_ARAVE|nr:hypothetical protein AVEN_145439-1 [Araneus ventricosus]
MQEKKGKPDGARLKTGKSNLSHPRRRMCFFVSLPVWGSCVIIQEQNPAKLIAILAISMRSFGIHLHLFPPLKSALLESHFQSNEVVKNFLRSLDQDFTRLVS